MSLRPLTYGVALGLVVLTTTALTCPGPISPTPLHVSFLVPATGLTSHTTGVTINGTGFVRGATVTFDGLSAAVTGITSTAITAFAPIHSAGAVDVVVTNPRGETTLKAGGFSYVFVPPPSIVSVSPDRGSTGGGTSLKVDGAGIQAGAKVTIDGAVPTNVYRDLSGTFVIFTAPAHAAGTVGVVIQNPDNQSTSTPGSYTYVSPDSFDFNGHWSGFLNNGDDEYFGFVIQNNALVSLLCNDNTFVAFQPVVPVNHGEVSASPPGGVTFFARIVSADTAIGAIKVTPRCTSPNWSGWRDSSSAGAILRLRRGR